MTRAKADRFIVENWVRTDEAEDVAGSVRHAVRSFMYVAEDPQVWKWISLSLHSALQGACVCHLTTSASPIGAVTKQNAVEWLRYFDRQRTDPLAEPPETYLMTLPDLLKAVRKPKSAGDRSNVAGVRISDAELSWLKRFHIEIRNQFVHFAPMSWSIEVSGLPEIAALVARVVTEIADIGYAFRHLDSGRRAAMLDELGKLSAIPEAS